MRFKKANGNLTLCAIHQPNFFPWLGYFDKIFRSDVFVLMDNVDYPRSGSGGMGSWTNRVMINIQGEPKWIGTPIQKKSSSGVIRNVLIGRDLKWRSKLKRTLLMNYRRACRFDEAMAVLEPLIDNSEENLSLYNTHAILTLSKLLGLQTNFVRQSEFDTTEAGTDLLIEICKKKSADGYLAGNGAVGYQEDEKFKLAGIELVEQQFTQFVYGDKDKFMPGLSIIDFLMHSKDWHYETAKTTNMIAQ